MVSLENIEFLYSLKEIIEFIYNRIKLNIKFGIISDSIVSKIYLEELKKEFDKKELIYEIFIFPAGESQKSKKNLTNAIEFLSDKNFNKNDILIAFGGFIILLIQPKLY